MHVVEHIVDHGAMQPFSHASMHPNISLPPKATAAAGRKFHFGSARDGSAKMIHPRKILAPGLIPMNWGCLACPGLCLAGVLLGFDGGFPALQKARAAEATPRGTEGA